MVLPNIRITTHFLWDSRPGHNCEHIAERGMTPDLWEDVFRRATRHGYDKDDKTVLLAEGRAHGQWYRIIYTILEDGSVIPLSVFPIAGFPIERRALR